MTPTWLTNSLASSFADSSQLAMIDKSGLRWAYCGQYICFTVGYHICPLTRKLRLILWAAVWLTSSNGNLVGCWWGISGNEKKKKNMLTFAVKPHTARFLPPTCSSASLYACQPCRCKHTHIQMQTHMMQLFKACDIERAQINLTVWQLSLHSAVFHTDQKTECFYLFSTPRCLLYLLCITQR